MKIRYPSVFVILLALCLVSFTFINIGNREKNYKVIAYVFGEKMNDSTMIAAKKLTHINYAFANIKEGKIIEGRPNDSLRLLQLNNLKTENPNLQLLISVGGWGWSGGFSDAVLTANSRETFANSAITFLKKHKLNGIDLDWEYPGQIGAGNMYRSEDKQNFTAILKLIRKKLDSLSLSTQEKYLLTIATGANQNYLDNVETEKIHHYLDFINIMTYDFHGEWDKETSHHTNLYTSKTDPIEHKRSAQSAVKEHVNAGAPIEKLVLGVAFYGRGWNGVNNKNNGLHQVASKGGFGVPYKNIPDSISTGGYTRYWDDSAKAPYLWKAASGTFITYDDEESLRNKSDFIKLNGMGGAMFWEYHSDNGSLLDVLYEQLLK